MTAMRRPRYSKEEFKIRGEAIFAANVFSKLKKKDHGRFAAIDIETEEVEIAATEVTACHRLRARVPDAQIWLVRIGSRYLYSFGGHGMEDKA